MDKLTNDIWDSLWREYGQHRHMDDIHADVDRVDWQVRDVGRDLHWLIDRVDRMALLFVAALSLLKEKTGITDREFLDRVRQLDLTDGKADGKIRGKPARCPKCGAVMSSRHHRCMWCGEKRLDTTAIDRIT